MMLEKKLIVFLGDSMTECAFVDNPDNYYYNIVGKELNCNVIGYGWSGSKLAHQTTPSEMPIWDYDFNQRVKDLDSNADMVVVFGGTNDFSHSDAPFGTYDDKCEYTFCGALNCLIEKLHNKYPNKPIIFITPPHRDCENNTVNALGMTDRQPLISYVRAIVDICHINDIPVLDLFKVKELSNPYDKKYFADGIHPNDNGDKVIARELIKLLKNL